MGVGLRALSLFTRQLLRVPRLAEAIQLVGDGEQWMTQQHAWAGVSHNLFGLGSLCRLVAVNGAVGAGRFVLSVGAFPQPHFGIVQKLLALVAQEIPGFVMVSSAIDANHRGHRQPLTGKAFL